MYRQNAIASFTERNFGWNEQPGMLPKGMLGSNTSWFTTIVPTIFTGIASGLTSSNQLSPAIAASLDQQSQYLRSLPRNWDGYNAPQISVRVLAEIINDLEISLANVNCRPPDLIPGADGSIQAEWHLNHLTMSYHVAADGSRYLYLDEGGIFLEFFNPDAKKMLGVLANRLISGSYFQSAA